MLAALLYQSHLFRPLYSASYRVGLRAKPFSETVRANSLAIYPVQNNCLWVFSNATTTGSAQGFPSNSAGMSQPPYQTLAFGGQQWGTMQTASDYYTLDYDIFPNITGYTLQGHAEGAYVDHVSLTMTPNGIVSASSSGGGIVSYFTDGTTRYFSFTPNPSKVPAPTLYPLPGKPGTSYRGINIPGFEFYPAFPPSYTDAIFYIYKGMNTVRIPFRWENLQPNPTLLDPSVPISFTAGPTNQGIGPQLVNFVQSLNTATAGRVTIILDMHNYMRYGAGSDGQTGGQIIGAGGTATAALYANAWSAIANQFKSFPNIMFDLMNEPFDMQTELILSNYNPAIAAVRSTGATNLILLEGNSFTCLGSWTENFYGTPNSTVFTSANIVDSGNNYAINVHNYFSNAPCGDSVCGGCIPPDTVLSANNLNAFVSYLQTNGFKAFLTEINGSPNPNDPKDTSCVDCFNIFLGAVEANAYTPIAGFGFIGWTAWASRNISPQFGCSFLGTTSLPKIPGGEQPTYGIDQAQWPGALNNYLQPPAWIP